MHNWFLESKPLPVKTLEIAKTIGLRTAKEVNPILYPLQRRNVIVKCSESPVMWKISPQVPQSGQEGEKCATVSDKPQGSVEVIFPRRDKVRREKSAPSHHWVSQLHKTFFGFSDKSKYDGVTHVIGFVPTTVKAAVEIRNQWKFNSEKKDPNDVHDAKVVLVNIGHVKEVNDEDMYKETVQDWIPEAQLIFSMGPKLFHYYEDVYAGEFGAHFNTVHKMLMLFPDLLHSSERWAPSQAMKIITFCTQDLPAHIKDVYVVESSVEDYKVVSMCLGELAKHQKLQNERNPEWHLCGLKDVMDSEAKLIQIKEGMEDVSTFTIHKMSSVTSYKQLLTRLRNCAVVIAPEGESDSFNLLVWEAIGFGTPVLVANDSGVANLLVELNCSLRSRCVVHLFGGDRDKERWTDSLHQNVLNRTAQPGAWASQLRDSIINHPVIQTAITEFLVAFNLEASTPPTELSSLRTDSLRPQDAATTQNAELQRGAASTHHVTYNVPADTSSRGLFAPNLQTPQATSDYQQPQSSSAQDQLTPVPDQHHSFPSSHFPIQPASSHSSLQHQNPVQLEGPVPHQLQSYTVQQVHTPQGATAQTGVPSPGMAPQAEPPAEIVYSQGMVPQGVHVSPEPAQWQGSMQGGNQQVRGAGPSVSGHPAQGDITIPSVPHQLSSLLDIGPVFSGQGGDQFHPARGDVAAHQGVAPVEDTSFHTMSSQGTTLRDVALGQRVQQSSQFQPLEGRTASPIHQQQRGALQHTQMDHGSTL